MYFMKKFCILITLLFSITTYSQTVMNNTYLDVPLNQVNDFLELHKKVVDMSDGEQRTIDNHWVYRHWYGNDHSIMLGDLYSSAEAAVNDDFWAVLFERCNTSEATHKIPRLNNIPIYGGKCVTILNTGTNIKPKTPPIKIKFLFLKKQQITLKLN